MNHIHKFLTIDRHHERLTYALIFKLGSIDIHEKIVGCKLWRSYKLLMLLKHRNFQCRDITYIVNFTTQKTFERNFLIINRKKFYRLKFHIGTIPVMRIWFHEEMFVRNPFGENKGSVTDDMFWPCPAITIGFDGFLMHRSQWWKRDYSWKERSWVYEFYFYCIIIKSFDTEHAEIFYFSIINLFAIHDKIRQKSVLRGKRRTC